MDKQIRHLYLFNCDGTYKLDAVERLFLEMNGKLSFQFSIVKKYFALGEMSEMCSTVVPELQMDFAVFVVEANESRLSINEENAGIGYAKFYRALLQATGDKVLIVVGGDTNYKNEDEKDRSVVSRWVRKKLASQFTLDFLDGRKSFIFSWNKNHRPIHKEALLHYFDPGKDGMQFVPQPKVKPPSPPCSPPVVVVDPLPFKKNNEATPLLDASESADQQHGTAGNRKVSSDSEEYPENPPGYYTEGLVVLHTRMRYGKISYEDKDVVVWDGKWLPPDQNVRNFEREHKWKSEAIVQMTLDENGKIQACKVVDLTPWWKQVFISLYRGWMTLWNAVGGNGSD